MKYVNAAEILPEQLLNELQNYINGEVLYVPKASPKKAWGTNSGSRNFFQERNQEIKKLYHKGYSIDFLMEKYGLAYSTIKKIIYE